MKTALALQGKTKEDREARNLLKLAKNLAVVLEAVHPGTKDPHLAPYFMINVPDRNSAERIIQKFTASKAVEGAYIKPADELP